MTILKKFPELKTKRLKLIEIGQAHLADYYRIFSDDRATKYYNILPFKKENEAQKYLDWFAARFKERLGIRWGIALQGEDGIIGTVGFNSFAENHRASLGYDLQLEYWNKGIVTEALQEILSFGFTKLSINRVEAEVMQGNVASEKVLFKLGFTKEGTLRDWMYWNGKHYDMTMFSLLAKNSAYHQ